MSAFDFHESANFIKKHKPSFKPKVGIVLGSGVGDVVKQITDPTIISYDELPHFPKCTTAGHAGKLHLGYINKTPIVCLQGRAHFYEGIDHIILKNLIRTIKLLGCELLILTCACGTINQNYKPGSLAMISDHINFQFLNVLRGPNEEEFGPRFPSLDNAYDAEIRKKFFVAAEKAKIKLGEGVYIASSGPTYETHAEVRAFRTLGADFAGMSTVPEVMVARHCGLKVAAIAVITNMAAGLQQEALSHEEVLIYAKHAASDFANLLQTFFESN